MAGRTVKFGAVGDILFARAIETTMRERGVIWPFEKMLPALRRADVLFGNMESVVLPPDYPLEQRDPAALVAEFDGTPGLKEAGFDFMNLAQNHVLDGGTVSMFHTRDLIERLGIATGGVGRTQEEARRLRVLEKGGLTFGFLCYAEDNNYALGTRGPCHAYYTREAVLEDVQKHRDAVDVLVVSVHADLEFMETPSLPRRELFREIADAGATLVLGHHPHVPQGVERRGRSLIAYSLGNFVFTAHSSDYMTQHAPQTDHTYVLLVDVSKGGVEGFERVPGRIRSIDDERPVPLEGAERQAMLDYFASLDRKVLDDAEVKRVWRARALDEMGRRLATAKDWTPERVVREMVGRLLFTRENREWVDEVIAAGRECWEEQTARDYTLHRPHYCMTRPVG